MNRSRITALLAGLCLSALVLAAAAETYTLIRTPKVGEKASYKFSAEMTFGDISVTISGKNSEEVEAVNEDGSYTIKSVQSDVVIKTPDEEQKMDGTETSNLTYAKDRVLKEAKGEEEADPATIRLSLVTALRAPEKAVEIGAKWDTTIKALGEDTYDVKANYEILGKETVGKFECLKVKISSKEQGGDDPAEAEGTIWISATDFTTVKESITIKNAPIALAPTPIDLKVSSERID